MCVCVCVRMHTRVHVKERMPCSCMNRIFIGSLVIRYSSVSVPDAFWFLFLPGEALNLAFGDYHHYVLLSNKHDSGTFFFCWDSLISLFLPSLFTYSLFSYSFSLCFAFPFHSSSFWNSLSLPVRLLVLNLIRMRAASTLAAMTILVLSHW